jgi:hypothetical protein
MERLRRDPRAVALAVALAAAALIAAIAVLAFDDGSDGDAGAPPPPGRACTLIACAPGVTVRLPEPPPHASSARVCIDGACGRPHQLGPVATLNAPLPRASRRAGARVSVTVELLDDRGRLVERRAGRATVTRSRPNGPDCPPVCFQAEAVLRGGR